jgi:N-acyl-D-amino-acid deacylase
MLFRPDDIVDQATYDEPKTEAAGIDMVVVNGQIALEAGQHSGVGSGQMLQFRKGAFGS